MDKGNNKYLDDEQVKKNIDEFYNRDISKYEEKEEVVVDNIDKESYIKILNKKFKIVFVINFIILFVGSIYSIIQLFQDSSYYLDTYGEVLIFIGGSFILLILIYIAHRSYNFVFWVLSTIIFVALGFYSSIFVVGMLWLALLFNVLSIFIAPMLFFGSGVWLSVVVIFNFFLLLRYEYKLQV